MIELLYIKIFFKYKIMLFTIKLFNRAISFAVVSLFSAWWGADVWRDLRLLNESYMDQEKFALNNAKTIYEYLKTNEWKKIDDASLTKLARHINKIWLGSEIDLTKSSKETLAKVVEVLWESIGISTKTDTITQAKAPELVPIDLKTWERVKAKNTNFDYSKFNVAENFSTLEVENRMLENFTEADKKDKTKAKKIQQILIERGHNLWRFGADGSFWSLSKKALAKELGEISERRKNLKTVDLGKKAYQISPEDQKRIDEIQEKALEEKKERFDITLPRNWITEWIGIKNGAEIATVQRALRELWYNIPRSSKIEFDNATQLALIEFKKEYMWEKNPKYHVERSTSKALVDAINRKYEWVESTNSTLKQVIDSWLVPSKTLKLRELWSIESRFNSNSRNKEWWAILVNPNVNFDTRWNALLKYSKLKWEESLADIMSSASTLEDKKIILSTVVQYLKKAAQYNNWDVSKWDVKEKIQIDRQRRNKFNTLLWFNADSYAEKYYGELEKSNNISRSKIAWIAFDAAATLVGNKTNRWVDLFAANLSVVSRWWEALLIEVDKPSDKKSFAEMLLKNKEKFSKLLPEWVTIEELAQLIIEWKIKLHFYKDPDGFDDRVILRIEEIKAVSAGLSKVEPRTYTPWDWGGGGWNGGNWKWWASSSPGGWASSSGGAWGGGWWASWGGWSR